MLDPGTPSFGSAKRLVFLNPGKMFFFFVKKRNDSVAELFVSVFIWQNLFLGHFWKTQSHTIQNRKILPFGGGRIRGNSRNLFDVWLIPLPVYVLLLPEHKFGPKNIGHGPMFL